MLAEDPGKNLVFLFWKQNSALPDGDLIVYAKFNSINPPVIILIGLPQTEAVVPISLMLFGFFHCLSAVIAYFLVLIIDQIFVFLYEPVFLFLPHIFGNDHNKIMIQFAAGVTSLPQFDLIQLRADKLVHL